MTVTSDAARRGAVRRERTRTAALDATEALMTSRSPDAVRVEDVAEAAGISPASVYSHFGTKDALIAAAIERLLDTAESTMRSAYQSAGSALDRFQRAGVAYLRLLLDHPALTRYIAVNGLRPPESVIEKRVGRQVDVLRHEFEVLIRAAVDAGEIVSLDVRALSYFLFGAWNGVTALALRHDSARLTPAEIEHAVLQASQILVNGATPSPKRKK